MQKTLAHFIIFCLPLWIGGCAKSTNGGSKLIHFPGIYRINIQQGNIITKNMTQQLRLGITKDQIRYIMGSPVLKNGFNLNKWDFIYSMQHGNDPREQRNITLSFEKDKLINIRDEKTQNITN